MKENKKTLPIKFHGGMLAGEFRSNGCELFYHLFPYKNTNFQVKKHSNCGWSLDTQIDHLSFHKNGEVHLKRKNHKDFRGGKKYEVIGRLQKPLHDLEANEIAPLFIHSQCSGFLCPAFALLYSFEEKEIGDDSIVLTPGSCILTVAVHKDFNLNMLPKIYGLLISNGECKIYNDMLSEYPNFRLLIFYLNFSIQFDDCEQAQNNLLVIEHSDIEKVVEKLGLGVS